METTERDERMGNVDVLAVRRARLDINRFCGTLPYLCRFVEAQGRTHH